MKILTPLILILLSACARNITAECQAEFGELAFVQPAGECLREKAPDVPIAEHLSAAPGELIWFFTPGVNDRPFSVTFECEEESLTIPTYRFLFKRGGGGWVVVRISEDATAQSCTFEERDITIQNTPTPNRERVFERMETIEMDYECDFDCSDGGQDIVVQNSTGRYRVSGAPFFVHPFEASDTLLIPSDGEYVINDGNFGPDIGWHLITVEDDEERWELHFERPSAEMVSPPSGLEECVCSQGGQIL